MGFAGWKEHRLDGPEGFGVERVVPTISRLELVSTSLSVNPGETTNGDWWTWELPPVAQHAGGLNSRSRSIILLLLYSLDLSLVLASSRPRSY